MNNHVNGTLTAMRAAAPPSPRFSQEGPGSGGPYPTSTPSPVHRPCSLPAPGKLRGSDGDGRAAGRARSRAGRHTI